MSEGANPELLEKLETHAVRVRSLREYCSNEEQTKVSLINPYLEHLGFDVRDPRYVQLEYRSDIGSGTERVDYALLKNGKPALLIEAKPATTTLPSEAPVQLRRYAMALPELRYCAVTNGVHWHWYAKSENSGDLNPNPFLVHDATDPNVVEVRWLASLRKDPQNWDSIATEQNLQTKIGEWFTHQRTDPDEHFIVSIIRGVNERNNQKTRDVVSRIWVKTIAMHMQKEIDKALRRASKPEQEETEVNNPTEVSVTGKEEDLVVSSSSVEFNTPEGVVRLGVGLRRAWRIVGEEYWRIEPNMTALCREIYLALANMHDQGIDDFFVSVTKAFAGDPNKSLWIQRKGDLDAQQVRRYTELTPEWCFHHNANNETKINRLREIAPSCISSGKSVLLNDHFEIWDPRIDRH